MKLGHLVCRQSRTDCHQFSDGLPLGVGRVVGEFQDVLHLLNDGGFHLHATVLNELVEALLKVGLLLV